MANEKGKFNTKEFDSSEKLKRCAKYNSDHIGEKFAPKGPWVSILKTALNAWRKKYAVGEPPLSDTDVFDAEMGNLVHIFKSRHGIFNTKGEIDRIVGIKTVEALDAAFHAIQTGKKGKPVMDVVVFFRGFNNSADITSLDEIFPKNRRGEWFNIKAHRPVLISNQASNEASNQVPDRYILRLGQNTDFIDDGKAAAAAGAWKGAIENSLKSYEAELGDVYIYGSSSGALVSIKVAKKLSGAVIDSKPVSVYFVAAVDAPFFHDDSLIPPIGTDSDPTNTPFVSKLGVIPGSVRLNFFQRAGNRMTRPTFGLPRWASKMAHGEIHGEVANMTSHDLTSSCTSATDDLRHRDCVQIGNKKVVEKIEAEISARVDAWKRLLEKK